ncbi:MAG: hypothetical protein ACI4DY_13410 [Monoglobaceae bacterium]
MRIQFSSAVDKTQLFINPAIGILDERSYYGYTVIAIAFAWLHWKCKVEFGVRRYRNGNN